MPNHDYTPDCRVYAAGGRCDAMRQLDIATELNIALAQDAANELRTGAGTDDMAIYEALANGCEPSARARA